MTWKEEWITAAPRHWTRGRIKNLIASSTNGTWGEEPSEDEGAVKCIRATDFNRQQRRVNIESAPLRKVGPADLARHRLNKNDLIIEKSGGGEKQPVGMVALYDSRETAVCSNFCARIVPARGVSPRYLNYAFQAAYSQGLTSSSIKQTTGIQNLDTNALYSNAWAYPAIEEQRRIADFLDAETGKIDGIIHKKRRLISLMNERIDSRIMNHVGESRLVNSRTGTTVQPLRRILTKVFRFPVTEVDVITAYRDGQVTARGLRRAEGYTLSASTEPQGQNVQVDDVVIHGLDGFAGAIGTSEAVGNCSPVYHVCIPAADGDPKFLGRLLRLLALQGYLGNFATSTRERAVDFRNWDLFGRIPIPVVSNEEQCDIGRLITNIGPIRGAIERSEVLATERRRTLITAAVTGQFDVSTASGRGVME